MAKIVDSQSIDIKLNIKYTNKEPLPISEVVKALISTEKLIKRTKPFFDHAYPELEIIDIKVNVNKLESGSWYEDLTVELMLKDPEKVKDAAKIILENANMGYLLVAAVSAITGAGIAYAIKSLGRKDAPNIYNYNLNLHSNNTGITGEQFQEILKKLPDQRNIAKEAISFIAPARLDKTANIEWEYTTSVKRDNAIISHISSQLNLSSDVVDDMFIKANKK